MDYIFSKHQQKQVGVINKIEKQINDGALEVSTVAPVDDFDSDPRICLTSVHFPKQYLIDKIQKELLQPLKDEFPQHYFYCPTSLHMTIKNIRVINDPPHFSDEDIKKVRRMYSQIISQHKSFKVYFYRLFFFPLNLALMGTTDPELDRIFLHLDKELEKIGVGDDKQYANSSHFFSNMTLVRFSSKASEKFKNKAQNLFQRMKLKPYIVDSVTLIKANASLVNCARIENFSLK